MPPESFAVRLKLFAIYQEVTGRSEWSWEVGSSTTVGHLCDQLIEQYPSLAGWRSQTRFGVNLEFVPPDTCLQPNDEIVFIPPVSGG